MAWTWSKFKTVDDRFWNKVKIGDLDACWEWQGARDRDGYGQFKLDGKQTKAHRTAYRLAGGRIPDGMCVRVYPPLSFL